MIAIGKAVVKESKQSHRSLLVSLLVAICFILLPVLAAAGDLGTEREVQKALLLSKALVVKIAARQQAGQAVAIDIVLLKVQAGEIAANHRILRERFVARDVVAGGLGPVASARQGAMREEYFAFIDEYLAAVTTLPDDSIPDSLLDTLKSRLESLLPEHPAPLLGALPYRHLRLPSQLPATTPTITPAYLDHHRPFTPADLAGSPEAPITPEIAALAQSLHWVPAQIYGWVKNNIKSEWYWGLMKGATETLHQRSGNDADQAALLVALLRASGYPARFVRGTIELFPNPAGVLAHTGVSDVQSLAGFFQKAGIPWQPVIKGGVMANLQIEHIWVETYIPYGTSRGATVGTRDKTWLGLDTQIKLGKVTVNNPPPPPTSVDLPGLRDRYLTADRPETPLEYLRAGVNGAGVDYDSLLHHLAIADQLIQIVPASLPFHLVAVSGEYTTLPEALTHRARFTASHGDTVIFDGTLPLADLSNRSLAITYEPATVGDHEIINSYGGLGNTPAYLIHLRPVLTVDGERTLIGRNGLSVGSDFKLAVELIAPNHRERIENQLIIGNLAVLGLVAQQVVPPAELAPGDKTAERLLHERALDYIDQWNQAENELAALLNLPLLRPMPTLVTVGGVVEVIRLLDTPHGFDWRGVYVDADFRSVELVGAADKQKTFTQLSGLQGSVLEARVLEEGFGVEAVSTAKLLGLSNGEGLPPLVLNRANLATELPGLGLPANVAEDITNAVAQGLTVTIPPGVSSFEDWQGIGYRKEDPDSGEAGWMLSGSIAGGMTAWNPERWPLDAAAEVLANPFNDQPNRDPNAVMFIQKVTASDLQVGTVGQALPKTLQVYVSDRKHKPVKGAEVIFTVKAGGGSLASQTTQAVKSDYNGVAQVVFTLGQHTADNPVFWTENGAKYSQQAGENIVEAALKTGATTASHFTAYALPDTEGPISLQMTSGDGGYSAALALGSPVAVIVADQHGNSIANREVTFSALPPTDPPRACTNPSQDHRPALLLDGEDPCLQGLPIYGDGCGVYALSTLTDYHGAHAQVLLGGRAGAVYQITAAAVGCETKTFTRNSAPAVDCRDLASLMPITEFSVMTVADIFGRPIIAGKVGEEIPLAAQCLYLLEDPNDAGSYYVDNVRFNTTVEMTGPPAIPMAMTAPGSYRGNYRLSGTAGVNPVTITCTVRFNGYLDPVDYRWYTIPVTGVDLVFPYLPGAAQSPKELTLVVAEGGYLARDVEVRYQIVPAEYQANTAFMYIYKDGAPIILEPVETKGTGFATLARGVWLEPGGNYAAEVVLNQSSESEISSGPIPLRVVELELAADLNRDGNYAEGDPVEHTSPGLLLPLNSDDDDGDGVLDYDDGYDKDNLPGNADDVMEKTNPDGSISTVTDGELTEVQLTALPGDLAVGTVVLELIQGQDQVRVWSSPDKGKGNVLLDAGGINGATSRKVWVLNATDTLAKLPQALYLEGVKAATNAADTAIMVTKYISPEGVETEADRLLITVYQSELVPDYDRNGIIDEQDRAKVNGDKPWRFWVNDDNDGAADGSGIGSSENDLPGLNKDNADGQVNGIRDLVDFFPVQLDLGQLITLLPPEQGYNYWLRRADAAVAVVEGIKVDPALLASNSGSYLTDIDMAKEFAQVSTAVVTAAGIKLSDAFIQAIKDNNQAGIVLLEGRKETTLPLVVEVRDDGDQPVASIFLPLEIVGVEKMYGHRNLRTEAGGPGGVDRFINFTDKNNPDYYQNAKQPFCMQGVDKTLVWMHGHNVNPQEARGTYAEVFKRFFHAGLTGRFYGVSWYGDPPAPLMNAGAPAHYHQAVVDAFATAQAYKDFVSSIPGTTSIAAHSLGNLVVGSAIHDKGLAKFAKYFAVDAAVALEAYGQVDVDEGMVVKVDNWLDYWKYEAPDNQGKLIKPDQELLASEWYKRFPASDKRSELKWRNRLAEVVSPQNGPNVYNFYSKTEEVLRAYPDDDLVKIGELFKNWKNFRANLATSAWVKQEKYKGRRSIFNVIDNIGGVSSPFAGWSFNSDWDVPKEPPEYDSAFNRVKVRRTPEQAALIDKEELKAKPFFDPPMSKWFGVDLAELVSDYGSDFVDVEVKYTGLDSYYTSNNAAHDKVKVKDWLLAEAFPATTLPMGANKNGKIDDVQQINMSGVKDNNGGCCKTSEGSWPRDDTFIPNVGDWKHSDYKDVPYQLVFEFYSKINALTK